MDKKGIHLPLSERWSDWQEVHGKKARYRLWNKRGKTYCLKLVLDSKNNYQIEISNSLENLDTGIEEIFELKEVPFDSQYKLVVKEKDLALKVIGGETYKNKEAEKKLTNLFKYEKPERLLKDLLKETNLEN